MVVFILFQWGLIDVTILNENHVCFLLSVDTQKFLNHFARFLILLERLRYLFSNSSSLKSNFFIDSFCLTFFIQSVKCHFHFFKLHHFSVSIFKLKRFQILSFFLRRLNILKKDLFLELLEK